MTNDQSFLPGDEPRDDVEGHARMRLTESEADVEGHGRVRVSENEPAEDDVEGHVNPKGL